MIELEKLRKEAEGKPIAIRSCWKCNPAHEHLKKKEDSVILCPHCGNYFYKGVKLSGVR